MRRIFWISAGLIGSAIAAVFFEARGAEGTVLNERVNVRTRPSIASEVIHQLNTGDTVNILERIRLVESQPGEPKKWYRIAMPAQATLWVSTEYIDADTKAVKASRLNVRAGPGENFSVVGRIEQNTIVAPIRASAGWMAIQPLPGTIAYIAAEFVRPSSEPKTEPPAPNNLRSDETPPIISDEEIPEIIIDAPGEAETNLQTENRTKARPKDQTLPPPIYTEEPVAKNAKPSAAQPDSTTAPGGEPGADLSTKVASPIKRIITRDGIVRRSRNIQAPAFHRLEDPRTGATINYLHTGKLQVYLGDGPRALKSYEGHKIRVIGTEAVDARWPQIPVIEVEELRVLE